MMNGNLRIETLKVNEEDFVEIIVDALSDDDTDGTNGFEFLWEDAREWFGFDPDKYDMDEKQDDLNWYFNENIDYFTNDNYLKDKYREKYNKGGYRPEDIVEELIKNRIECDRAYEIDYDLIYDHYSLTHVVLAILYKGR